MNSILQNGKMKVENQTNTQVLEDSSFCPETSTKNAVQEFHLRTGTGTRKGTVTGIGTGKRDGGMDRDRDR
jgi:hypothetical protein